MSTPTPDAAELPAPVHRLLAKAGTTMRTARNPCITARESIVVGDWIASTLVRIAELEAALNKSQKDAARLESLIADFSPVGLNIDGNHSWAYRRNFSLRGPTLRAAIDAAIDAARASAGGAA